MKHRPTLLSAIAIAATALVVAVGGAAHADNVAIDGDALTIGTQSSVDFGAPVCGTTATKTVTVAISRNGNGQVFANNAQVTVTAISNNPVVTVPAAAGTITMPSDWSSATNNELSTKVSTVIALPNVTANVPGVSVTFTATGAQSGGGTLTRSASIPVTWTTDCSVKTDTTTSVSCPTSVTYTGAALEPCTAEVTGQNGFQQSLPVTYSSNTNTGTATATASFTGDGTHNASSSGPATFQITPAGSTTTLDCPAAVTYTGQALTPCTATVTTTDGLNLTAIPAYTDNTDVGTAHVTTGYAGDDNHAASDDTATFAITGATATCAVSGFAGDYDGAAHGATGSCSGLDDVDLSDGLDLGASFTGVPGGAADWTFTSPNYLAQNGTAQITIGRAASSIAIVCSDTVYDGTAQTPCTAKVTGAGGLSQDLEVSYSDNTNAGQAIASASYAGDDNHTAADQSTTFTIAKAGTTTTITCDAPVTYTGEALTPCSAQTTSEGGTITGAPELTYTDNTNAGTAGVTASYTGDDNHQASGDEAHFTIDRAASSMTLTCPSSEVYTGEALTPCTATVSGAGLDDVNVDVVYTDNTDAGAATAQAAWAGDLNHIGTTADGGFTIDQASSTTTVTCPAEAIPFTGSPIEPCTARVTGVGGLDEAVAVDYTANVHVGPASASATFAGDRNHLGGTGSADFEITKATSDVTITCDEPVTFDTTAHMPCRATATGAGDLSVDVSASLVYSDNVNAGTAHVSASYTGDDDHDGSTKDSTFTIGRASSTTVVSCPVRLVFNGSALTPCTARVTGIGGLDQSVEVTYEDNVKVGTATATATFTGDDNHLDSTDVVTFQIGAWTINGFYKPIDMGTVVNTVKGGSTVPLKFTVTADGTPITDTVKLGAKFNLTPMTCGSDPTTSDDIITTTGGTSLRYDASAQQWVQNWQTPSTSAGNCYKVTLTTADGSSMWAFFKMK